MPRHDKNIVLFRLWMRVRKAIGSVNRPISRQQASRPWSSYWHNYHRCKKRSTIFDSSHVFTILTFLFGLRFNFKMALSKWHANIEDLNEKQSRQHSNDIFYLYFESTNGQKNCSDQRWLVSRVWVFTARRHASVVCYCSIRLPVRLSVCHKPVFYQSGNTSSHTRRP